MKNQQFILQRYDADENKVFDWKNLEAHTTVNEDGEIIQEHLNAKTIFLAIGDTIDNYVEVDAAEVI